MGTKAKGDSCYDKAASDEPIFVLRAHDRLAPVVVRQWVMLARGSGVPRAKCDEAEKLSIEMDAWQAKHGAKMPD